MDEAWEQRLADAWAAIDQYEGREDEFRALIHEVTAELPEGDPVASYERGGSWDSTGHPHEAIELYRAAMRDGLDGARRRQCSVQLASSLRNLGEAEEGAQHPAGGVGRDVRPPRRRRARVPRAVPRRLGPSARGARR